MRFLFAIVQRGVVPNLNGVRNNLSPLCHSMNYLLEKHSHLAHAKGKICNIYLSYIQ